MKSNGALKRLNSIRKPNFGVTFFEGGLGSQILAYLELINKIERGIRNVSVNVDYFKSNFQYENRNGLTNWSWKLNHYGINLDDLVSKFPEKKSIVYRSPNLFERTRFILDHELYEVSDKINEQFQLSEAVGEVRRPFLGNIGGKFAVVHWRLGDYVSVSSRVQTISELTDNLLQLLCLLPENIIFVSDGIFDSEVRRRIEICCNHNQKRNVFFYDHRFTGIDDYQVHALMRVADVLVTSNSTFSYSAGLLSVNPNPIIFFPTNFFGIDYLNHLFQSKSSICLMTSSNKSPQVIL
jgi:hypothetical protein